MFCFNVQSCMRNNNKRIIINSTIKDLQDLLFIDVSVINDFARKIGAHRTICANTNENL